MKLKLLMLLMASCIVLSGYAQSTSIKGKITDDSGGALPGAGITLKGTSIKTVSSNDGSFSLNSTKPSGNVLIITFLGYSNKEVEVGPDNIANIQMSAQVQQLNEVVTTALNISREKKSLGYASQGVDPEQMTKAPAGNFSDLLIGKVAGLQVTTSGQPTGSTRLQLRGANSITGNNQPLYVIDGVPIDNNDSNGQVGNLDYGNNASIINPNDVESIEVMKGPNAAALYGSKAANGAILITTKKGKKNGAFEIAYNGNYMASQVSQYPFFQNVYGEGNTGRLTGTLVGPLGQQVVQSGTGGERNWGMAMLGQPYRSVGGQLITYSPQADAITNLFKTGGQSTQNVSISNATDNASNRFSYTRYDGSDVIDKQNIVKRNNFQLNSSKDFSKKIKVEVRMQYNQQTVNNRTYRNEDPLNPLNYLNNALVSIPLSSLIPWKNAEGNALNTGSASRFENPYWSINENSNQDKTDAVIGGVTATYTFTPWLRFRAQQSGNLSWGKRNTFIQKGSLTVPNGAYSEFQQNNSVWNSEGIFFFNKRLKDLSIVANLGGNLRKADYYNTSASTSQLLVQNIKNLTNNGSVILATENEIRSRLNSVFATLSLGYKDFLYVDATGRNDWSSTLPPKNASFFYPSVSASFVFTEFWKTIPKDILSFGKIRASIAKVGNDTQPYNVLNGFNNGGVLNGVSYLAFDTQLKNADLKPELTTSTEIGTELRFFNNRISIDASVYKSKSINQLLIGNTPRGTGFSNQIVNAGEVQNKGIEIALSGTPIKNKNFSWDAVYNFSMNRNIVLALAPGINSILLGGAVTGSNYVEVGQPIGVLRGLDQMYDANGIAIINPARGIPYYTSLVPNFIPLLGYASPRALMSFGSTFRYKDLSLNFLASARFGGSLYSGTSFRYNISGVSAATLQGRDEWLFSDGILGENDLEKMGLTSLYNKAYPDAGRAKGAIYPGYYPKTDAAGNPLKDANGFYIADLTKPNTKYITAQEYWQQSGNIGHMLTYDASFIKLTQVILTYNIPKIWLQKTPFKNASISAVGRNLWTIYQKTPKGIDPESAAFSGNAQGLEQGGSLPYSTYGLDLKFSL